MERARTHRTIHSLCRGSGGALVALFAAIALLAPLPARAWHSNQVDWDTAFGAGAYRCYDCHTLNGQAAGEGVVGTSFIAYSSRTMPLIMAYSGGSAPANLGCTYCHNTPGNTRMKDALNHFGAKTSKHPVGKNWVTDVETNREYLSSASPNVTATTDLDCVDCHDAANLAPSGYYMSHNAVNPANPFFLKDVTVDHEYDAHCRACHGSSAPTIKGQNERVTSHADASAGVIEEDDGTDLKTSTGSNQCTKCHDTHYSGKVRLFNDGHEADTAIVSTNCTAVCHQDGDQYGNYTLHGHGRTLSTYKYKGGVVDFTAGSNYISIGMTCTSCHGSLDTSDTSGTRKAHVENPTGGSIQDNYKGKFNLDLSIQAFDTGSVYGNPQSGVCYSCHSTYETHAGVGGEIMGCQDCHDEHAEGSGSASNYFMIPELAKPAGVFIASPPRPGKAGAESIIYNMPRRNPVSGAINTGVEDFYSPGATGFCDSTECHGAAGYAPLSAFASHTGGSLSTGMDCAGCHKHNGDPEGGWRATASCSGCHSYPGLPTTDSDHLLSGVHTRHVEAAPTGYGFDCETCHFNYTHNQSSYADNSGWTDVSVPPANINVRFNTSAGTLNAGATNLTYNTVEADASAAPGIAGHNGTCAGLFCHGNSTTKQADWAGANETPAWGTTDPAPLACGDCHGDPPATPASNAAHTDHLTSTGYVCGDCHSAVVETTHVNGTVNLAGGLSYTGGLVVGDGSWGTCSTGSCHNVTAGTNITWNAAATNCNQCHYRTAAGAEDNWVGNDKSASMVVAAEYTGYGHGKSGLAPLPLACTACHVMSAGHDFTPALGGANPYRLTASFTCSNTTAGCHQAGKTGPVSQLDISTIQNHDKALMGASGKRTWPWTPECVNCHDPHGDGSNIAMIGNEVFDAAAFTLGPAGGTGAQNTALVFTNTTLWQDNTGTSYADANTPFSSICQECHTAAGTGMLSYLDETNTSSGAHPGATGGNPGDCGGCHKHSEAFKPSGCTGCHGNGGTQEWPDNAGSNRTLYPDRLGRHLTHLSVIGTRLGYPAPASMSAAQQNYICQFCHNDPAGAGGTNHYPSGYTKTDSPADVGSFNQMWGTYADDANDTFTAASYTGDVPNANTGVCGNLDCHNAKTQPTGQEWYGASASSCLMCHTVAGAGTVDPNTGMHDTAVTTGIRHDDNFLYNSGTSTAGCATCHISGVSGPTNPTTLHFNGAVNSSVSSVGGGVFIGTNVGFTDAVVPTCRPVESGVTAGCHFEQYRNTPGKTWSRLWHESGAATDGTQCKGCHGTFTQGWNSGMVPDHMANWDQDATPGEARLNHDDGDSSETQYNQCKSCHVYNNTAYLKAGNEMTSFNLGWLPAGTSTNHGDGSITMNSTMGYTEATWNCTGSCHANNNLHALSNSSWTVKLVAGPSLTCTGCHNGSGSGATLITMTSTHTYRSRNSSGTLTSATGCTDCHPGGTRGMQHLKNGDANVVAIPNYATVGINYGHVVTTGVTGFVLGGNYTTGTNEAEICWNCHMVTAGVVPRGQEVSEWGTNTDTNAAANNFNFGSLSTANWFTGTWSSANFRYKRGRLTSKPTTPAGTPGSVANGGSTHSVNAASATSGVDNPAAVRCSYCHKVHGGTNGDGATVGRPFLRGTWKGNPYREDGAPRYDTGQDLHTYTDRGFFGLIPRGNAQYTEYGGYQIDQNNNSPASTWTYANMAGLCQLCHGATINALSQYGGVEWSSGANSHGAVVVGGTGPYFNLMAEGRRHTTVGYSTAGGGASSAFRTAPWMGQQHLASGSRGYSFRGSSGYVLKPTLSDPEPFGFENYTWGATVNNTTTNNNYHKFSCSKCHTPHASRLPRLLITNCLDTKVNTWQAQYQASGASTYSAQNLNVRLSNLTSAQNCHRRRDPSFGKSWTNPTQPAQDGWNSVSPW